MNAQSLYWSVRRELWENRSIYIAPLVVAAVMIFGFAISTIGMPERRRTVLLLDEAHQRAAVEMPYEAAEGFLILTAGIVGVFYCLDALYGERRDRSILFWKSMPVSDLTTVVAKASIPLVILPVYTFIIILATQFMILLMSTAVLLGGGLSFATIWPQFRFVPPPLVVMYALWVIALWHAPIYGWLLLVSGWAKRATLVWAVLPFFVPAIFETIAFHTSYVAKLMRYRLIGWMHQAFIVPTKGSEHIDPIAAMTPLKFFSTPGLWIGLLFAAGFLIVTVRMRRYREPI